METSMITLALVDDHTLFRKGLISLIELKNKESIQVIFEASDGLELQDKLKSVAVPNIILMDINMPKVDGFESVEWLKENYPLVEVIVVSMIEKEESVVRMLKLGVKGYLSKDVEPEELSEAIRAVAGKGYYYTDFITGRLIHSIHSDANKQFSPLDKLNDREKEFLTLASSEHTYTQIADLMYLSPKTIDGYRKNLFEKLSVKNRVGLVLFAVKHGLVKL